MTAKKHASSGITESKISFGDRVISYRMRYSRRARWLRLEVKPESGLTVVVPPGCGAGRVTEVLMKKQGWIVRTLAQTEVRARLATQELRAGDSVLYLGGKRTIVSETGNGRPAGVLLEPQRLVVMLDGHKQLDVLLEEWYRVQAANTLKEKIESWSARLGLKHNGFAVRGQRARWGSCSAKGKLSFNWKLMMLPEALIDYVVIHELTHLAQMNHSPKFWQLVAVRCPQWRERRKQLKAYEIDAAAGLQSCR